MRQQLPITVKKRPLALFLIALLARLAVVAIWRFDGLYGQDSFAYFQQALAIAENLSQGRLSPPDFFWPNGFPLLVALSVGLLGQRALAAQLVGLLCGSALAPLAYGLGEELFPQTGRRVGTLAGLIVATAGQVILSSVVVMSDVPALFWAMLAAWLLVRAWRQTDLARRPVWLLCAGAALALAVITRWIYTLLIPAFAAYVLYQTHRQRSTWWSLVLPVLSGTVILLPQLWLSLHRPGGLRHAFLSGWRPGNAFQRQFETADGLFSYPVPVGLFYAQPVGYPAYLFPPLGLAALWAVWRLWRRREWGALILLLGWSGPVYLFLAGIPFQSLRFGLTLYPPLVLLASYGVSELWERSRWRRGVQVMAVICLVGMLGWAYPMLDAFLTVQNHSKALAQRVEEVVSPDATLVAFGLTLTLQHYTSLHTLELFFLGPTTLDALTRRESTLYLIVDPENLQYQWRDRPPELNYRWLQEHTTLTPIGSFLPYRLYRVQRGAVGDQGKLVSPCASR